MRGRVTYTLVGPPGLELAENILIGNRNRGRNPQRRPLVLTSDEHIAVMMLLGDAIRDLEDRKPTVNRRERLAELKSLQKKVWRV